jgi:thiol-disulfide isomerase/thioredoxin
MILRIILACLLYLPILAASGQDYKFSNSRVSVQSMSTPILNQNIEGQKNQPIFIADSVRYYDENGKLTDSSTFMKKTNSGAFISVINFDQTRDIMTYSMMSMPKPENAWVDKKVPDFAFNDLNGKHWDQNSIEGKVVVFHFWFTRCLPCITEFPLLNELKNRNPDVIWFAVSFEDSLILQSFLKSHQFDLNIIPNQQEFATLLNVKLYPRTIIVDKRSIVKDILCGPYQDSTLLQQKINYYSNQ